MRTLFAVAALALIAAEPPVKLLFLGDDGGHRPAERFKQLQPALTPKGFDLTYTKSLAALDPKVLAAYDGLVIYANQTAIAPAQEKALLDYVAGGKGLIALHCASYCFHNSPAYIDLVGAQFQKHGTGIVRTKLVEPGHPILQGFTAFESFDETYVHTKHNPKDRLVLETREDEPWTWVRTHGKGRVFYTAWGHDERTWSQPGFVDLVARGGRWAVGRGPTGIATTAPEMTALAKDAKPFEYVDANVPFYSATGPWGTMKPPQAKMQLPLSSAESMKHYSHPVGFELKLFIDEAQLGGKPICMSWDERGRLWVAVTVDYPNELQPRGQGRDRILICEDTDGDGAADKVTVFADKLSIPTSLCFARGGVIVLQAPETLFLKDTDGDERADVREVLFTGWSTSDTHAGPSNLHYGFDNWIYGIVGYAGFRGTVGGQQHRFQQGFYRFKPDGSKLEFLRSTNNNSWGVGFTEDGLLVGSTANGVPSVYLPIPNRYYEAVRGWAPTVLASIARDNKFSPITDKVRQVDYHGGFTAAAGHAVYTARTYPPEYWNRTAFVCEPTGHLAATFVIDRQGADLRSHNAWNLLASDDEWAGPTMAEVGPDGNVWIIDWYAFIVQHNPTPAGFRTGRGGAYETPLRDKKHGRIYRLVAKGAKPNAMSLARATPEQLVAALTSDNLFWRRHAQRLLVERGKADVVPALLKLAADPSVDAIGLNAGAIHALWTLHGLGAEVPATALRHPSAGVRRNAVAVVSGKDVRAILDAKVLMDDDAQVRLAALLALAEMPASAAAGETLAELTADPKLLRDRWLVDGLTAAAAAHDRAFLGAIAIRSGEPPLALIERIAEHYGRGGPVASIDGFIVDLAKAPGPVAAAALAGLARGWPANAAPRLSEGTEATLAAWLPKLPTSARGQLVALTRKWGSTFLEKNAAEIAASYLTQIKNESEPLGARIEAAGQFIELRRTDAAAVKQLLELITPQAGPALVQGLLDAAGKSDAPATADAIVALLPGLTPATRPTAVRVLLGQKAWTATLVAALEQGTARIGDLTLDQRAGLISHSDKALADKVRRLLASGGGLPDADREKVVQAMLPLTKDTGDATAGKLVFKNQCAKCHQHSGDGNRIGPDLTGMAVHTKEHLLIDILDPSRSVEGNYRKYSVTTTAGRVVAGLLAGESATSVELLDEENKRHLVQRGDIDQFQASQKSLMPDGFEKLLGRTDLVNLLEFMTARGRYLPLPLEKAATIVSTKGMFFDPNSTIERLVFADWGPKTVDGVPFQLVDPLGGRVANAILLFGPQGTTPPKMPKSVRVPYTGPAKAIHILGGVAGWGFPYTEKGATSLIVRLHYADGATEDHPLKNGLHIADYIRRVDVPDSKHAFDLAGKQLRTVVVTPRTAKPLAEIEFRKDNDRDATAPIIMAVTVEGQ